MSQTEIAPVTSNPKTSYSGNSITLYEKCLALAN